MAGGYDCGTIKPFPQLPPKASESYNEFTLYGETIISNVTNAISQGLANVTTALLQLSGKFKDDSGYFANAVMTQVKTFDNNNSEFINNGNAANQTCTSQALKEDNEVIKGVLEYKKQKEAYDAKCKEWDSAKTAYDNIKDSNSKYHDVTKKTTVQPDGTRHTTFHDHFLSDKYNKDKRGAAEKARGIADAANNIVNIVNGSVNPDIEKNLFGNPQ